MSEVKSKPILFSSEMVRKILANEKAQTRRVIKPQPDDDGLWNHSKHPMALDDDKQGWWGTTLEGEFRRWKIGYENGMRLWVRETFYFHKDIIQGSYGYTEGEEVKYPPHVIYDEHMRPVTYRADYPKASHKWIPSIYMPRSASRITLEVAGVKVERLQDMGEDDLPKEGIEPCLDCDAFADMHRNGENHYNLDDFLELWDSINGKTYPWESNPWVVAVSFRRVA